MTYNNKTVHVIHSVNNVGKHSYGLGQIAVSLAKNQFSLGLENTIYTFGTNEDIYWASQNHKYDIERFQIINNGDKISNIIKSFQPNSYKNVSPIGLIHQHGIWGDNSFITLFLKKKYNVKSVVSVHGSLTKLALKKSKLKKRLALMSYEGYNLKTASALHATSMYEIDDYRGLGLKNPIAYIDNGIDKRELSIKGTASVFIEKYNLPINKRRLLYLSRITPKKGLDMLLYAIKEIENSFKDWILVIVGNDEFNYQKTIEDLILELNLSDKVFIIEPQFGDDKYNAFASADFFILPSYSEGAPMVVLDSLASGTPVITTKSSSWENLNVFDCGYWVDINQKEIENSLLKMTSLSKEELLIKGNNAKKLIKEKYLWEDIAKQTILLYEWLNTESDLYKPDFIYLK